MKRILSALALGLLAAGAQATPIVNSFGLSAPETTVTFSEVSFSAGTLITNQFAGFGVTTSGHHYNSQGNSPFPGISGDYIGVSTTVPFVLSFSKVVTAAAFGYAKNPTTVLVEALLGNTVVESFSQAVTYDNANTAFLGFSGIAFDAIRVTANVGEGLVDNVQIGTAGQAVPEPAALSLLAVAVAAAGLARRSRKRA